MLVFDDLESFEEYWSGMLYDASLLELNCFSHDYGIILKALWVEGEDHRRMQTINMIYCLLNLTDYLAEVVFVRVLHCNYCFPYCPYCTLRKWEIILPLL